MPVEVIFERETTGRVGSVSSAGNVGHSHPTVEVTYSAPTNAVITAPYYATSAGIICRGNGGAAEGGAVGDGGNGGGGGAVSIAVIDVAPGQEFELGLTAAAAGVANGATPASPTSTYVSDPPTGTFWCRALGGANGGTAGPGAGGPAASGTGDMKFSGGDGAAAVGTTGGGGGAAASTTAAGGNAAGGTGGTTGGADGGDAAQPGGVGDVPGGGGAGSTYTDAPTNGASGTIGEIVIVWNPAPDFPAGW